MNQYYKLLVAACFAVTSFAAKAQCDTISNFMFNNITSAKAVVTWDPAANIIQYEYGIRTDNLLPIAGTYTSKTNVSLQGLSPDQTIYVCVRTHCNTGLSQWTCHSFKTLPASTGISNASVSDASVYPNPVKDILNFNFTDNGTHQVTIVNSIGVVVSKHILQSGETSLNLSNLQEGLYFVKTASENNIQTFKIDKR